MKSIWPIDLDLAQGFSPRTIKLTEVDSTMRYLASLLEEDPNLESFTTVVADHQWAGKGRFTRRWMDASGDSVLMAVLVDCPHHLSQWVPLLAGISAVQAVNNGKAEVKWPNDVMVDGHKVAGILCELAALTGEQARVIVGMGMNITQVPAGAPHTAGSVVGGSATLTHAEKSALAVHIANRFLEELHRLLEVADENAWYHEFSACLYGVGQHVRVTMSGGRQILGINRGIDTDGALLVEEDAMSVCSSLKDVPAMQQAPEMTDLGHGSETDEECLGDGSNVAVDHLAAQERQIYQFKQERPRPYLVRVTSGDVAVLEKKTEVDA